MLEQSENEVIGIGDLVGNTEVSGINLISEDVFTTIEFVGTLTAETGV